MRIEDDLADLLTEADRPLADVARGWSVLDLLRRTEVSWGRAAELLGIDLESFQLLASRAGISVIDLAEDEWTAEEGVIQQLVTRFSLPARRVV